MTKNVFVVGLNELNADRLTRLRGTEDVAFHQLLTPAQVSETQEFDIPAMLAEAEATLDAFDGSTFRCPPCCRSSARSTARRRRRWKAS